MQVPFRAQVLHVPVVQDRLVYASLGTEFVVGADAGFQVFHLGLHEAALVARREMMHCGNAKEIAFMDDDHARPKLRRLNHFSKSFSKFLAPLVSSLSAPLQCERQRLYRGCLMITRKARATA